MSINGVLEDLALLALQKLRLGLLQLLQSQHRLGQYRFRQNAGDIRIEQAQAKSAKLLEGYRGGDPGDVPALRDALLRMSEMVDDLPELVELDLNPVKVRPPGDGIRVVDARMRVRPVAGPWVPTRWDLPAARPARMG